MLAADAVVMLLANAVVMLLACAVAAVGTWCRDVEPRAEFGCYQTLLHLHCDVHGRDSKGSLVSSDGKL